MSTDQWMYKYLPWRFYVTWRDRWMLLARRLPRKLKYWAFIAVVGEVSTGKLREVTMGDISVIDAIKAFNA